MSGTVLVVRLDSVGDVLLVGPAVRAVAAGADRVVMWCGRRGRAAAELLPGVDEILEWTAPWIDPEPVPLSPSDTAALVARLAACGAEQAVAFTSWHQSALPAALLLRLAGVARVTAISEDYPGSLLDVRHHVEAGVPEPERALSLAAAAGFRLPAGDDGRLRVRTPLPDVAGLVGRSPYVVVHPATSVPARAWPAGHHAELVRLLAREGVRVVVTGTPAERDLTASVAGEWAVDLGGRTDLPALAGVLAGASAVVVANTGPAHLAAAVGTPVVSLFAPTVPLSQWAPYGVDLVVFGDQSAACRGTRAKVCPVPGHPCLSSVQPPAVAAAVLDLLAGDPSPAAATAVARR